MTVLDWLLDSDPSVRWQALRDLAGAPPEVVNRQRARVTSEGWGARLLALRGDDGQWAGGAYFPAQDDGPDAAPPDGAGTGVEPPDDAGPDAAPPDDGSQPWTATTYSLLQLRDFGADPASAPMRQTLALVRDNCRWEEGGQAYFSGEVEPCINGMTVQLGAFFGQDVGGVVARLLQDQLDDGGWNCWAEYGAKVSSAASTINVLEGLLAHEQATGGSAESTAARRRGEEYLLERKLFRRKSTGTVIDPSWLEFSYPTRWYYDVLRALEYFRSAGDAPDPRLAEAVELLRSKKQQDGTWLLENTHPGQTHFELEDGDGRPSRWNTLRALRVLRWYDSGVSP
jgi:hypothetical protein